MSSSVVTSLFSSQHTRFVQECKDAEPDVLFVGDSMVQLMQQFEVRPHTVHIDLHRLLRY